MKAGGPAFIAFRCRGVVVGDLDAVLDLRAREHVGDEFVAVEPPPALLGGVEQLVGGYLTDAFLDRLAKAAGLNLGTFDADRATAAVSGRVARDGREAQAYGLQGTPSFTVNGPHGTRVLAAGAREHPAVRACDSSGHMSSLASTATRRSSPASHRTV